jgi:hypothetical protein
MNKKDFICKICNKNYASNSSLWNHNNNFHKSIINNNNNIKISSKCQDLSSKCQDLSSKYLSTQLYNCRFCNKCYDKRQSRWYHEQKCKIIFEENNNKTKLENKNLKNEIKQFKILLQDTINKKLEINLLKETNKVLNNNIPINNQLINIIVDKTNIIEELKNNKKEIINNNTIINNDNIINKLTLNNIIIESRNTDNYINATQLCQAGNKKFNNWFRMDSTKLLIKELEKEIETTDDALKRASSSLPIIEINKGSKDKNDQFTWIHPDLAIQLAQWISPSFALQVSKWIRLLFSNSTISINTLKMKDQEIQLLKDSYLKKQKSAA